VVAAFDRLFARGGFTLAAAAGLLRRLTQDAERG
jgi:hypothetical protein